MTNIKKIASETKCTIVVIGDSRTGKSALLHRFVHKTFQPVSFLKHDIYFLFLCQSPIIVIFSTMNGKVS